MKQEKICLNCIWYEHCGNMGLCDDFTPLWIDKEYIIDKYEQDLHMRIDDYQLFIEEMNNDNIKSCLITIKNKIC